MTMIDNDPILPPTADCAICHKPITTEDDLNHNWTTVLIGGMINGWIHKTCKPQPKIT